MNDRPKITPTPSFSVESGEIYDLVYAYKDYEKESEKITKIIMRRIKSGGDSVLEAACGTGSYLQFLQNTFDVSGFDLSGEQIAYAKKKLPSTKLFVADMADFKTNNRYDAVLCLFSSIGYLSSKAKLTKTIKNFARHTKPGGVVIVEPWLRPEQYTTGYLSLETNKGGEVTVARMGTSSLNGKVSVMQMHYMIGRGEKVGHFVETHKVTMFSEEDFTEAFLSAGLELEIDRKGLIGRGLYIGTKPLK